MDINEKSTEYTLKEKLKFINIGLEMFYDELKSQDVAVLQVDWSPPADGDKKMAKLLERLVDF
jgi:FdrA protein